MKAERFLFVVMIAAVMPWSQSLAAEASPAPQLAISQNSDKSANTQQKNEGSNEKEAREAAEEKNEQLADVRRTATKRRLSASHSKPGPSHAVRAIKTLTPYSARIGEPGNTREPESMSAKAATNIPNKSLSRHGPSAPSSAVSVNGQQFKNSRNPGARLVASGGPLAAARGAAAINGTGMKHKP